MKTKILQELKQRYSNLGVSDKAFDGVADFLSKTITEEERIPEVVGNAESFLKAYQSDVDKERTSVSKLRKELEGYKKEQEPKPNDPKPNDNQGGEATEREKEMMRLLEAQQKQIDLILGQRSHEGKMAQITALLGEKKIPESFYSMALNGRTFNNETDVDSLVSAIEQGYTKFRDESANDRFSGGGKPEAGGQPNDDAMAKFVELAEKGTEQILNDKK
nr:MAG TPA: hypothetical protein [Caudoviricetes sp.]